MNKFLLIFILIILAHLIHAQTPVVVDQSGDVGKYCSLSFNKSGQPVITFYDATNHNLKIAEYNGSGWDRSTIDNQNDVGMFSSLAITPDGNTNISYYDATIGALKYQGWVDYSWTWTPQTVYNPGNVGQYNSLDFDSEGQPVITSYDQTNTQLILSYLDNNTSQWKNQSYDNSGDVGQYSSIAIVSNGDYNISYYDADRGALKYEGWIDYTWQWQPQTIASSQNVGMYNSIDFSPGNVPYISYYNSTSGDLMLSKLDLNTSLWSDTTIDQTGDVGQYSSIDIDNYGNAGISYYDVTNSNLKFADNVVWQNLPPYVENPMEDLNLQEDFGTIELEDLDDVFEDADQQPLTFNVNVNNPNLFVKINSETNIPSFWTSQNWYGNGQIIFSASDGFPGGIAYDTIDVRIQSVNDPPQIIGLNDTSFYEDKTLTLKLNQYVIDVDHDTAELNWQVSKLNNDSIYFQFNQNTNIITFTAPINYTCTNTPFRYVVTDPDGAGDTTIIKISVKEVNDPPQWVLVPDTTFNEDDSLYIELNFFRNYVTDPDDVKDSLTFSFFSKNIFSNVEKDTLKLIPSPNWFGLDTFKLKVKDPFGAVDSTEWYVKVININDPPQIINLSDFSFINTTSIEINLSKKVVDVDNSPEELKWKILPDNDSLLVEIHDQKATFTAKDDFIGIVNTQFIVSDPFSLSDTSDIFIEVTNNEYKTGIYLTKSSDEGMNWSSPKVVPNTDIFHHAQLTKINNKFYIYGVSMSQDSVLYMTSEDNGFSWTNPIVYIDNLNSYYTSAWLDESGFYVLTTSFDEDSISLLLPNGFLQLGHWVKNISFALRNTSNDIVRSAEGNLYIAFLYSDYYNRFMRSTDGGNTWQVLNLSKSALYYPKYSLIGDKFISVSNFYGSFPPYDSYIKYTMDDGDN